MNASGLPANGEATDWWAFIGSGIPLVGEVFMGWQNVDDGPTRPRLIDVDGLTSVHWTKGVATHCNVVPHPLASEIAVPAPMWMYSGLHFFARGSALTWWLASPDMCQGVDLRLGGVEYSMIYSRNSMRDQVLQTDEHWMYVPRSELDRWSDVSVFGMEGEVGRFGYVIFLRGSPMQYADQLRGLEISLKRVSSI